MPATRQYSVPPIARARTSPVRPRARLTLEELLRRAAASVDRGPAKVVTGTFLPTKKGRVLTRKEKWLMILMAAGLSLAIWLHSRPEPVSAHTVYYQSLAASNRIEAGSPLHFVDSALGAIGTDWRAASLFACVHPSFWQRGPAIHPDLRAARLEQGLALLAGHGPVVGVTAFPAPTSVETETVDGVDVLAARVAGQLELADGVVVRFAAHLVQDATTKRWGLAELAIPGFLP
jgi:hypothetical protein